MDGCILLKMEQVKKPNLGGGGGGVVVVVVAAASVVLCLLLVAYAADDYINILMRNFNIHLMFHVTYYSISLTSISHTPSIYTPTAGLSTL
jgi:hypothetical protein